MQPINSAIGIADLLHAISILQPKSQQELDRIARSLGFNAGLFALDLPDYNPTPMAHNPNRPASPPKETQSQPMP